MAVFSWKHIFFDIVGSKAVNTKKIILTHVVDKCIANFFQ